MSRGVAHSGVIATHVPLLDRVLYYALLALLCVRPLISESFTRLEVSFLAGLGGGGANPATTALLDNLLLVVSVVALARVRPRARAAMLALLGVVLLAAAVVVSSAAAGDRRAALNAGFDLLVFVLAGAAMVSLLRARWMVWLLLASVLACGAANATKCLAQWAYEFDDAREYWQGVKQRLVTAGQDPDNPALVNYERRLLSGETFGYLSHPNVAGSCLMMWLLALGGLLAAQLRAVFRDRSRSPPTSGPDEHPRDDIGPLVAIALMLAGAAGLGFALWLTGSAGAIVSAGAGVAVLLLLGLGRAWIGRHARRVFVSGIVLYLAVIGGAVAVGTARGTLPHPSLAFRWYYWTAAASAYREAPLTGVGRENFADAYLRHKHPDATEEVRNPHNLWITMLVELGPLGLAGAALLCGLCVFSGLKPMRGAPPDACDDRVGWLRCLPAVACVPLLQLLVSGERSVSADMLLLWMMYVALVWAAAMGILVWGLNAVRAAAARLSGEWVRAGLTAALVAALIHNLISFSLITPAGLSIFAALAAGVFALWRGEWAVVAGQPKWARPGAIVAGVLIWTAHLVVVAIPTLRGQAAFDELRALMAPDVNPALLVATGERAVAADPLDAGLAQAASRATRDLSAMTPNAEQRITLLQSAAHFAEQARRQNSRWWSQATLEATIQESLEEAYLSQAQPERANAALRGAVEAWQRAAALYPSNPRTRISAGTVWYRSWRESEDRSDAQVAIEHFTAALARDARRAPEDASRLRDDERHRVRGFLEELRDAGFDVSGTDETEPRASASGLSATAP